MMGENSVLKLRIPSSNIRAPFNPAPIQAIEL